MGRIAKDDRCLIKGLRREKNWGPNGLIKVFPRSVASMNRLIKKLTTAGCGSTERKSGSGRPRSLMTADNVSMIQDMIRSQDDASCSHKKPRKIQEHIERWIKKIFKRGCSVQYVLHCNLSWIFFIKHYSYGNFVVADGSINQTLCVDFSNSMCFPR